MCGDKIRFKKGDGEELSFSCLEFSIFFSLKYFIMSEYHFYNQKSQVFSYLFSTTANFSHKFLVFFTNIS